MMFLSARTITFLLILTLDVTSFTTPYHPTREKITSALWANCRVCRQKYSPLETAGTSDSCRYHPGVLRGESPRKSNWETSVPNDKLIYTYECCGGDKSSFGCKTGKHKSYDDQ